MLWIGFCHSVFIFKANSAGDPASLLCHPGFVVVKHKHFWWQLGHQNGNAASRQAKVMRAWFSSLQLKVESQLTWWHKTCGRIWQASWDSHLSFYPKIQTELKAKVHLTSSIWTHSCSLLSLKLRLIYAWTHFLMIMENGIHLDDLCREKWIQLFHKWPKNVEDRFRPILALLIQISALLTHAAIEWLTWVFGKLCVSRTYELLNGKFF